LARKNGNKYRLATPAILGSRRQLRCVLAHIHEHYSWSNYANERCLGGPRTVARTSALDGVPGTGPSRTRVCQRTPSV